MTPVPVTFEIVVPLSTAALCLITAGTAVAIAALTLAVVGLYGEVKRLRERMVDPWGDKPSDKPQHLGLGL